MIIVDTNVISEMMKPIPSPEVIDWIDEQDARHLFITTITIAEIAYGLNILPAGNRHQLLEAAFNKAIIGAFEHRILAFDDPAAYIYGELMGRRKELGRPLSVLDGQIAAIAYVHGAAVATRDINDFAECGLDLVNPF